MVIILGGLLSNTFLQLQAEVEGMFTLMERGHDIVECWGTQGRRYLYSHNDYEHRSVSPKSEPGFSKYKFIHRKNKEAGI